MSVMVISVQGKPLDPTTPRKARILLRDGKAKVVQKDPFTIQLNYKTGGAVHPVVLGADKG